MLRCFAMIWNYDNFSRQNKKFGKIYALSKNHISPNFIVKKIWHIGATINTIFKKIQNISFEISSRGKYVFWEKGPQEKIIVINAK
jgi:hypothetical protein